MEKETFTDNSIFQGFAQYADMFGVEWRREDDGGFYKFYEGKGDAFIYVDKLRKRAKKDSIEYTHNRFLDANVFI